MSKKNKDKSKIAVTMEGSGSAWRRQVIYDYETDHFFIAANYVESELLKHLNDPEEIVPIESIFNSDHLYLSMDWALEKMNNDVAKHALMDVRNRIKTGIEKGIFPLTSPI